MLRFSTFVIFYLLWTSVSHFVVGQESLVQEPETRKKDPAAKSGPPVIKIERDAVLRKIGKSEHLAKFDLGTLSPGKDYELSFSLANHSDTEVSFDSVTLACNCVKFETKSGTIPAGGESNFKILLSAPKRSEQTDMSTFVNFVSQDPSRPVIRLSIMYQLNNMFNIAKERVTLVVNGDEKVVSEKVPVLVVPPLKVQDLQLAVSENLRDLPINLVVIEGQVFIEVSASAESIPPGGISGEVALRRVGSKDADGFVLTVVERERLSISPESLRFISKNSVWKTKAVLKIQPDKDGKKERPARPKVRVFVGEKEAKVTLKELGKSGIFKMDIEIAAPEDISTEPISATWTIQCNGELREVITSASFTK